MTKSSESPVVLPTFEDVAAAVGDDLRQLLLEDAEVDPQRVQRVPDLVRDARGDRLERHARVLAPFRLARPHAAPMVAATWGVYKAATMAVSIMNEVEAAGSLTAALQKTAVGLRTRPPAFTLKPYLMRSA